MRFDISFIPTYLTWQQSNRCKGNCGNLNVCHCQFPNPMLDAELLIAWGRRSGAGRVKCRQRLGYSTKRKFYPCKPQKTSRKLQFFEEAGNVCLPVRMLPTFRGFCSSGKQKVIEKNFDQRSGQKRKRPKWTKLQRLKKCYVDCDS